MLLHSTLDALIIAVAVVVFGHLPVLVIGNDFEPYELNGGLVSAVAGKDYCLLASDTRMMNGGYEIFTRQHLASRLWSVHQDLTADMLLLLNKDGSVRLPAAEGQPSKQAQRLLTLSPTTTTGTFIASAGCSADCEALKRFLRMDVKAHGSSLQPHQVASLLSNTLYQRRGFPYYAFCVVAGCGDQGGEAYVYDAIGSYEQVAVASSGTGRELLQPVLDRLFSSPRVDFSLTTSIAGVMPKVVATQVDCTSDAAVERIIQAYQAVTEREIGVGDYLVIFVMQKHAESGAIVCKTIRVPLKQH